MKPLEPDGDYESVVRLVSDGQWPLMCIGMRFDDVHPAVEAKLLPIINAAGLGLVFFTAYRAVGRELARILRTYEDGKLALELSVFELKWAGRGLDSALLERIICACLWDLLDPDESVGKLSEGLSKYDRMKPDEASRPRIEQIADTRDQELESGTANPNPPRTATEGLDGT